MSGLTINKSQEQGKSLVTVLHLNGQLDGSTESQLLEAARQAHEEGAKHLLLDLSELTILTSAGLRAIQNILRLFTPQEDKDLIRRHGEEPYKSPYFKLVCPNPQIYYILNISGFLQNLLIYNDLNEAVGSFA
ncbi:MAG TPA: STAS domain-containing protein [Anaerolineales bacterium]|nr:STAS domain-containing protein [Anaerolineales bacterium]